MTTDGRDARRNGSQLWVPQCITQMLDDLLWIFCAADSVDGKDPQAVSEMLSGYQLNPNFYSDGSPTLYPIDLPYKTSYVACELLKPPHRRDRESEPVIEEEWKEYWQIVQRELDAENDPLR